MVLWATALLTVIAASYAFETRTEALLSANLVDKAKAEAAAEAGVRRAIVGLLQSGDNDWRGERRFKTLTFADAELRIATISEHGRIDLNAAPDALVHAVSARALAGLSLPDAVSAEGIADAILDWRDADHVKRRFGAEDEDYEDAGRPYGAADQAFVSVSELSLVQGIPLEAYRQLKKYFTVHTRASRIDPQAASRDVLLAIPGLDSSAVERFLRERDSAADGGQARVPLNLLAAGASYLSRTRPTIYSILVEARVPGGAVARSGLVIRLARSRQAPYLTLARLTEADDAFDVFADMELWEQGT